jgi:hypothetical protein
MPRKPGAAAESRRLLDRLRALALDPPKQRELAREIIAAEGDMFILEAALNALGDNITAAERSALVGRYLILDADGKRRDPGGHARATLISALRKVATHDDVALFERATTTEEKTLQGTTAVLNAAGLFALSDIDPTGATLHAVRLLARGGERNSGEPALSAARLLAASDEVLPLYLFLLRARPGENGDTIAQALRGLRTLPGGLLPEVFERFSGYEDDIVLVGLCDLIIEHPPCDQAVDFARSLMRSPGGYEVYHYLTTSIVASHRADLIALLTDAVPAETDRLKLQSLADALELIPGEPEIAAVARTAREKLGDMPIEYQGGAGHGQPPRGQRMSRDFDDDLDD